MIVSTSWLKNSVASVSWFTATAGRPSRTTSVSRSQREIITGKIDPKNPASVPGFSLIRNAWLSGLRQYFDWRSFFSSSKPTNASMIVRKPRGDPLVSFVTCSSVWSALQRIENFVIHGRADNQRRRVSESELLKPFGGELFRFGFSHR